MSRHIAIAAALCLGLATLATPDQVNAGGGQEPGIISYEQTASISSAGSDFWAVIVDIASLALEAGATITSSLATGSASPSPGGAVTSVVVDGAAVAVEMGITELAVTDSQLRMIDDVAGLISDGILTLDEGVSTIRASSYWPGLSDDQLERLLLDAI